MRHLLGRTDDKKQRAYLINHFLDQFKGTVYRQTMFAEFERDMGRMSEAGQALTADALSARYLELNKLYFGPDMISDDGIALEWARIPHFFYNYYVFQYATGFSAAVAIANRILAQGESAVADYKRFSLRRQQRRPHLPAEDRRGGHELPAPSTTRCSSSASSLTRWRSWSEKPHIESGLLHRFATARSLLCCS